MIKFFLTLLASITLIGYCKAQAPYSDTLDVVNWNLRYFADPTHNNPAKQVSKVRTIMNNLNADVYAICEVVDVDSFAQLAHTINGNYDYTVSTFGSFANNTSDPDYASAQKLGFIYRKSMVRNISTRRMMGNSNNAYYNFSSGRLPFQVNAEVLGKDSAWHNVTFMVMHAKAEADNDACTRRVAACHELKDTLDHYFVNKPFLLLGDYNDDLDQTICSNYSVSNYSYLLADSAHYHALTLAISKAGAISIDGYTTLIDHVFASNSMFHYYVPNSAHSLRTEVKSWVNNYNYDVSDHFPVRTQYVLYDTVTSNPPPDTTTGVNEINAARQISIYPNPANAFLTIDNKNAVYNEMAIYSVEGKKILSSQLEAGVNTIATGALSAGIYLLRVSGSKWQPQNFRLIVTH
ncbi:T9SS type A sorting domain-containing protein [Taibaiella soli]|nr:T9SS type A sorting domain-containing protein [Taibaiella soli]